MTENNFDFYYGNEAEQFTFYRIPKVLFTEAFKVLCCESKLLYGLMIDRMGLSIKNKWFDGSNRVYIIFSIKEVKEKLCCANEKAVKLVKELEKFGLIERKKQGQGKKSIIYVKKFIKKIMIYRNTHFRII